MARKRQSTAEDLVEVVSKFHWGVGVTLAAISFLLLHWYAGQGIQAATELENISQSFLQTILHVFAQIGQYILPLIFSFGAIISLIKSKKSNTKIESSEGVAKESIIRSESNPLCPKCGAEMLSRVAKKGSNAGNNFWGCSNFPKCRSTLPC